MDDQFFVQIIQRPDAAYHEAGHVVVALSLGITVAKVWIDEQARGCTEMERGTHLNLCRASSKAEVFAMLRRSLEIHVAGYVATLLRHQWACFGEWPTPAQMRKEGDEWDLCPESLVSKRFAAGEEYADPDDDLAQATVTAIAIWRCKAFPGSTPERRVPAPVMVSRPELLREIVLAERRVGKILKKNWQAVEDIAQELLKTRSGRVTHKRLMKLVGHHFKNACNQGGSVLSELRNPDEQQKKTSKRHERLVQVLLATLEKLEHGHPHFWEVHRPYFERMSRLFGDVFPGSPEKWEDDFRRDMHPEREMAFWTEMAKHYEHFTTSRDMTLDQKKEVFGVLMGCLCSGPEVVMQPQYLSRREVKDILEHVRRVTGTRISPIVVS